MKGLSIILIIVLSIGVLACNNSVESENKTLKVELKKNSQGHNRIYVDGEEFYVKGAGCEGGNIEALAQNGGNSFRTWMDQENHPSYESVLEEAQKYDVKVLMGLKLGRERHGYDYNNSEWVAQQYDSIKAIVSKHKDHPALLAWVIGNEINLGTNNMKVYDAVNEISKMIHEVDGNHLTTTTLAGIGKKEVDYIKENCTDIDFLCIQLYGEIVNLEKHITNAGWDGPYLVTEWGATGHWEVERTDWNVAIEPTSQEKAQSFIERYKISIESDLEFCMGSYAFIWGQKQERTPTWYGMFLENGNPTEIVDAMHYIWNNEWPENRCPTIDLLTINKLTAYDNVKLKVQEIIVAEVFAKDHENDPLKYKWEIMPESTDLGWGGDLEERPETLVAIDGESKVEFKAPEKPGAYRLFIYVSDTENQSATANIPFFVESNNQPSN